MPYPQRALALTGCLALLLCTSIFAHAAPAPVTVALHGTKMASLAYGVATVTQPSAGHDTIVVALSAMPVPTTLKTTPLRHAYVAWVFAASRMVAPTSTRTPKKGGNPLAMLGTLIPIALHATGGGKYTGTGTVMMPTMPGIIVSAEVSALVRKPALPFWGVLISGGTHH